MSTLTSSPSPAASPRSPFSAHYATSQRLIRSPRIPAYSSSATRPRTAGTATAPAPVPSPRFQQQTPVNKPQTADAGTQYTPKGLPPTARQSASDSKRKDPSQSSPMNPSTSTDQSLPQQPSEPRPEQADAPNANTVGPDGDTATNLPSRPAADKSDTDATISPSAFKRPRTEENIKIMPLQYETCNAKDLGMLISNMLMELIRLNDQIPLNGRLTRFHSRAPPGISCHDYLQRLIQHATLSPPILLSMVYYIDRLCALYPAFNVSSLTVHRFLIVAATVASKGLSDSFWTNPTYARIGGITTGELATLEMEFLQKVEWRIVPKPEVLVDYYISLVQRSEGYELEHEPHGATPSDLDNTAMEMDPP